MFRQNLLNSLHLPKVLYFVLELVVQVAVEFVELAELIALEVLLLVAPVPEQLVVLQLQRPVEQLFALV